MVVPSLNLLLCLTMDRFNFPVSVPSSLRSASWRYILLREPFILRGAWPRPEGLSPAALLECAGMLRCAGAEEEGLRMLPQARPIEILVLLWATLARWVSSSLMAVGSPCLEDPIHRMASPPVGPESGGVSCCSEGDRRLREAQGRANSLGASVPRGARWGQVGCGKGR